MDPGHHGPLGTLQRLGLSVLLWHLPVLLHRNPEYRSLGCIMDRIYSNPPGIFHWDILRPSAGRQLLPHRPAGRVHPPTHQRLYNVGLDRVLALPFGPRRLSGLGQWIGLLSYNRSRGDVFQQEKSRRHSVRCFWRWDGWHSLSYNRAATASEDRIRLDY